MIRRVTALEDKGQHPIYDRLIETIARVEAIEQDLKVKSSGYTHDRLYRNDPVDWKKQVEPEKPAITPECPENVRKEEVKESNLRKLIWRHIPNYSGEFIDGLLEEARQLAIEKVKEVYAEYNAYTNNFTLRECIIKKLEEM